MPCISIIVPVYQAEKLLPACVESVKKQTFSDWELLLVDDGCTDASPALCDSYAGQDPRIRALHQPQNAGVSEARNWGLREAMMLWNRRRWKRCGICGSRRERTVWAVPIAM